MHKDQILDRIREQTGLHKEDARRVLDIYFDCIEESLLNGGRFKTPLGSIEVVERASRTVKTPMTDGKVHVPKRRMLRFRTGRRGRALLNE